MSKIWIKYIYFFLLLITFASKAQKPNIYTLTILPDQDTISFKKHFSYGKEFVDTITLKKELQNVLLQLYANGYLTANYTSIAILDFEAKAHLHPGKIYKWVALTNGNIEEEILDQIAFREKLFVNKPIHHSQIRALQERLLVYAENHGHPFAVVKLDSIQIDNNRVSAQLFLTMNQKVYIDSISMEGNAKIKKSYLYNYLGMDEGDLYDESKIKKISVRLKELPFLKQNKPLNIAFHEDKTVVKLFLKDKKVSNLNGILGVLPNDKTTGKLLITGEIKANLYNPFGTGKLIEFNWRKLQTQTQDLQVKFVYPYVLSTPIGLDLDFKLYKKDTSYLDLLQEAGIQYLLIGRNYVKVFVKNKQSFLLNIDSNQIIQSKNLPTNIDISTTTYGLGYKFEKLDYTLNPRKGFGVEMSGGAGTKNIKKNSNILKLIDPSDSTFSFESLYDSVKLKTAEFQIKYHFNCFFPIKNRSVIKLEIQGAGLWNENIFQNDMYRIGGMYLLRGVDDESIFAAFYNIFTIEYRYLLGLNSYFYLFGDAAYYIENNLNNLYEWAYGFGSGISFETKAGIFSLSYALGKQFDNPVSFRSAKIHFGYVNYF